MGAEPSRHDILQDLIYLLHGCQIASTDSQTQRLEQRVCALEAEVRRIRQCQMGANQPQKDTDEACSKDKDRPTERDNSTVAPNNTVQVYLAVSVAVFVLLFCLFVIGVASQ